MKTPLAFVLTTMLGLFACEELDIREPGLLVPKTVDQDAALPSISVNNTQLHAQSFGDETNPMIVVLHGGPGSDYRYLLNCQALSDYGYYVVFYDQRGSGLSKREPESSYSIDVMLDDLTAVIAHYRTSPGQKVTLLGHSWGAMLATIYVNQYPTAIDGLILAEPGGFVWSDIMDYVGRSRSYGMFTETLNDATYIDQLFTGKGNNQEVLDYKFGLATATDGSGDNPIGNSGDLPFWRSGAIINKALFEIGKRDEPDWTTNLNQFTTKVLFIYSERNKAYGLKHAERVSSAYPTVQLNRINNEGHDMLSFENGWNQFLPLALTYLDEIN